MNQKNTISTLVYIIIFLSVLSTSLGIFYQDGGSSYLLESIRGQSIPIHGRGLYKHMSSEVAIQGIAQDYITLFLGIPLLFFSLIGSRKGSLKGLFLLTGTLGYFFVTYLFYTTMGMYNFLFLAYVALLCTSFFAFITAILSFELDTLELSFTPTTPFSTTAIFLIIVSFSIALLWLGIIVPPLLNGTIYPTGLEHYTTLIVQGLDLGLLLPGAVVSAVLLLQRRPLGILLTTTYIIFLSLMMTALSAKITAMMMQGYEVFPAIIIIPIFNVLTLVALIFLLKNINEIKPL